MFFVDKIEEIIHDGSNYLGLNVDRNVKDLIEKLNLYNSSKALKNVKEKLIELGCEQEFVDKIKLKDKNLKIILDYQYWC